MSAKRLLVSVFAVTFATVALAEERRSRNSGRRRCRSSRTNDYLREAPAPDYWNLSPFYIPQRTSSDCSAAAIVMVLNALRGLPANADQELVTENTLMSTVGDQEWMIKMTEDGSGVTFDDTQKLSAQGARQLRSRRRCDDGRFNEDRGRCNARRPAQALAENEATADNVMLVYFNQGVITGDWDGPHISAIGAYDAAKDRVLIMDVDRNWYVPYWTSTETLLAAMVKPVAAEHGVLAGGTGGYLLASKP